MKTYDVIIIGAGPAGIFAALEILSSGKKIKVLMIEKGLDIDERVCPSAEKKSSCRTCPECGLLCGWGGAGAFSDGKLTLSKEVGGNLSRYVDNPKLEELIQYTDELYIKYGAPFTVYGGDIAKVNSLIKTAKENRLTLIPSRIRHIGTDRCPEVLKRMKSELNSKVDIIFSGNVKSILTENGKARGIKPGAGKNTGLIL